MASVNMDLDPPAAPLHLYKETRVDIENPHGSIIQIQVPQNTTFTIRHRSTRRIVRTVSAFSTQDEFNQHYLCKSGSIHRCVSSRYPRAFFWRLIHDEKVLELRSVDLSKSDEEKRDAVYTIQLCFSAQVKYGGVALTDTDDPNVLNVFALTRSNEIYTIAIHKEFFCNINASEEETAKWCKLATPATFSVSTPHRLFAASSVRLLVSLSDGRLLQLTRKRSDDGSRWNEAIYADGHWGSSLRGLVRWQGSNTVRYDGCVLEQSTPLAMAVSPNEKHIFAVCMNHTLRIWNPKKAGTVFAKDLLWQQREPQDIPKVTLDPSNPNILQILSTPQAFEGDLYYAVTFSPHDLGQFKFWAIRDPDHGDGGVRDLFPDSLLRPPDPDPRPASTAIWKVVGFRIKQEQGDHDLSMWILMRSNRQYRLYNLQSELRHLTDRWQNYWIATAVHNADGQDIPQLARGDAADTTEKWLNRILSPHKYPDKILESALFIYCVDRNLEVPNIKLPLHGRLSSAVASQVDKTEAGNPNREKLPIAEDQEWNTFWQIIRDLSGSRYDVVSFALTADMPWIIFADGCSAIRTCTRLETMASNDPSVLAVSHEHLELPSIETETGGEPKLPDELAVILEASDRFRTAFSFTLQQNFMTALSDELWLESNEEVSSRLQKFYDRCNFAEEIEDGLFNDLTNHAFEQIGGIENLDTEAFFTIMESFSHYLPDSPAGLSHSLFGIKTVINGAREMIWQREKILYDLLALCVFAEMDVDPDSISMELFDGPRVFGGLLDLIKQYQVMQWLVENAQSYPKSILPSIEVPSSQNSQIDWKPTILETIFAKDLKPQSNDTQSQCEALTHSIQDLLQWVIGGNAQVPWDEIPVYIQCHLLAQGSVDLASSFLRFQPHTAWATYIKGRLCLLKGESSEAANHFKIAAKKLCKPAPISFSCSQHPTNPNPSQTLTLRLP